MGICSAMLQCFPCLRCSPPQPRQPACLHRPIPCRSRRKNRTGCFASLSTRPEDHPCKPYITGGLPPPNNPTARLRDRVFTKLNRPEEQRSNQTPCKIAHVHLTSQRITISIVQSHDQARMIIRHNGHQHVKGRLVTKVCQHKLTWVTCW
jgi:hypothetical protein